MQEHLYEHMMATISAGRLLVLILPVVTDIWSGSLTLMDDSPRQDFTPRQRHTLKEFAVGAMVSGK